MLKIPVNVPFFTDSALLDLKLSFNEKGLNKVFYGSLVKSREKPFKMLYNSIVRNFEFLWCIEAELSAFF